jgi:hypothetical protein
MARQERTRHGRPMAIVAFTIRVEFDHVHCAYIIMYLTFLAAWKARTFWQNTLFDPISDMIEVF